MQCDEVTNRFFKRRKKTIRFAAFFMGLFFITGSAMAETDSMSGCLELLQDRCQRCHYLNRVCQKVGEKSKRQWTATLKRMVKRRGADLTGGEQKYLLNCLATPDPGIRQECGK